MYIKLIINLFITIMLLIIHNISILNQYFYQNKDYKPHHVLLNNL